MHDANPPDAAPSSPPATAPPVRARAGAEFDAMLERARGPEGHRLVQQLVDWYDRERRSLPWRDHPGPYRTWVSEVMLQQTRVETVLSRFSRFLERFPTVDALAAAELDELLEEWAGLGYYSRARNLHAAARQVVAAGRFPSDLAGLRQLPGVGEYIAGAIASIALGQDEVAVDGNAERVLGRVFACDGTRRAIAKLARALLPSGRAGDFNQALMDLGSAVCTPTAPACQRCPVASSCRARARGQVDRYPRRRSRRAIPERPAVGIVVRRRGRVLLGRRPTEGLFGGLYELPGAIGEPGADPEQLAVEALAAHLDHPPGGVQRIGAIRHSLTHMHLVLELFALPGEGTPPRICSAFYTSWSWVDPRHPRDVALSTLARKALSVVVATSPR